MANIFAVTTTNDSIKLDAKRHGEATFTVSNTTTRPLRGMARIRALGDTKQEWLKLKDASERDFAAGDTHQFTVTIDAPPEVPPGKYGFRLDVASATNPNEDFTEGPTVTSELVKVEPPPPKPYWIIPVALILLVVIVGGIVFWLTRSKKVTIPAVEGQKVETARDSLTKLGLKFDVVDAGSTDPAKVGTVKSVVPNSGTKVDPGSTVTMKVYVPDKVVVKKVLGLPLDQAKQILENEQFLKVVVDPTPIASTDYKLGQVAKQSVAEQQAEPGSTITLTLAGDTVKVPPGIVNNNLMTAAKLIGDAGLIVNIVGEKLDGQVVKVDPGEGSPLLKGQKVTIQMPNTPCTDLRFCAQVQRQWSILPQFSRRPQ